MEGKYFREILKHRNVEIVCANCVISGDGYAESLEPEFGMRSAGITQYVYCGGYSALTIDT